MREFQHPSAARDQRRWRTARNSGVGDTGFEPV